MKQQFNDQATANASPSVFASDLEDLVKHLVCSTLGAQATVLDSDVHLIQYGLDSLQALSLAKKLNDFLLKHGKPPSVNAGTVCYNSSVKSLTATISELVQTGATSWQPERDEPLMQQLHRCYTQDLPLPPKHPKQPPQEQVILLTGSTGNLGSYILDSLRREFDQNDKIICLNRGPNSRRRQQSSLTSKGLRRLPGTQWFSGMFAADDRGPSITYHDGSVTEPNFGLSQEDFVKLSASVTLVIHGAWPVNFNLPLGSFTPHIAGVRRLAHFSTQCTHAARIIFLSDWTSVACRGNVHEKIYHEWDSPLRSGYAQSKFVSERILDTASRESGIPVTICRVGQAAGPSTEAEMWPKHEWLPSLIASSIHLGMIPDSLGQLQYMYSNWTPVDKLAHVITELIFERFPQANYGGAMRVYHVINPEVHDWTHQVGHILAIVESQHIPLQKVPLKEWLQALQKGTAKIDDIGRNPAVKLLSFFEEMAAINLDEEFPYLETRVTIALSPVMFALGPILREVVRKWMKQWGYPK